MTAAWIIPARELVGALQERLPCIERRRLRDIVLRALRITSTDVLAAAVDERPV